MRTIEGTERLPITIPLSEVLDAKGNFSFVPEVLQKGYFDIDYRQNELVLIAGKFIGQIPLTDSIAINVKPKVPLKNLARLISIANQPIRCLDFFRRKYSLSMETAASFLEGMARSLIVSLKELDAEGVYREYKRRSENLSSPRGRIDFNSYVRSTLARGMPSTVACTFYVLEADTTWNRIIKLTLWTLGRALSREKFTDINVIRSIEYFYDKFEAVHLDLNPGLLTRAGEELLRQRIPELRSYYADIVDICFVILRERSVEILSADGVLKMQSFVLNLEDTFERYIRTLLSSSEKLKAREISVGDGNVDALKSLFADNLIYSAKPDYVIQNGQKCLLIGDAKYKTKLAEADRYQLISHALCFGAPLAFFVTPALTTTEAGPVRVGTIGQTQPIQITQYRFALDAPELQLEENRFIDWILSKT